MKRRGTIKDLMILFTGFRLALMALGLAAAAQVYAGPKILQDWRGINGEAYSDKKGSKSEVTFVNSPEGMIAEHKFTILPRGWAGFWQNPSPKNPVNLSKARTLKFKIKCTLPGNALVGLYDKYHVQYIAGFKIPSSDFTEITVPISAFIKNRGYTPPNAIQGHGMDLTKTDVILFAPHGPGTGVMRVGPVYIGTVDPYVNQYPAARDKYLASGGKMDLPEDARKYFVQAEDAVKGKEYYGAVNLYYKGLEVAPWYPQAHYNLAILLAEHQNNYPEAVEEMKKYLELEPNAPDARAAQDKIYVWESKGQ